MSKVEILIDPDRVSRARIDFDFDHRTGTEHLVYIRHRIGEHLATFGLPTLRVRLDPARFRRLLDLSGLSDLSVIHVSARRELGMRLGSECPTWCTDTAVLELGLLDAAIPEIDDWHSLGIDDRILALIDRRLIEDIGAEDLLYILGQTGRRVATLLASESVGQRFGMTLSKRVGQSQLPLIFGILTADNYAEQLRQLFKQVLLDRVRLFVQEADVQFSIEPRHFPAELTTLLKLTPDWWRIVQADEVVLGLTDRVIHDVATGKISPCKLAGTIFGYSQAQCERIRCAILSDANLATFELLGAFKSLGLKETEAVESFVTERMRVEAPAALPAGSSAKQTMEWADQYLNHARSMFRRESEPDAALTASFSDWVVNEPLRFGAPQFNWRRVADSVRQSLAECDVTVLIVADALGAIVSDRLVSHLRAQFQMPVSEEFLFGPLPTITEVAKIAVATGRDATKSPTDTYNALIAAYSDVLGDPKELQFSQAWRDMSTVLNGSTRLLVFYDNQLDNQLHDCTSFSDLSSQLEIVCTKLCNRVKLWAQSAEIAGKSIRFFITSDHGLSYIRDLYQDHNLFLEKGLSERCVQIDTQNTTEIEGFYRIKAEGNNKVDYLVPKARVRLSPKSAKCVHGALSPEEVLIPLITIDKELVAVPAQLSVNVESPSAVPQGSGWIVDLRLTAGGSRIQSGTIRLEAPFVGEAKFGSIGKSQSLLIALHATSPVPQEGVVTIKIATRFVTPGATSFVETIHNVTVSLRPHIFIRDEGADAFDDMFGE